jgi:hypothetical protein
MSKPIPAGLFALPQPRVPRRKPFLPKLKDLPTPVIKRTRVIVLADLFARITPIVPAKIGRNIVDPFLTGPVTVPKASIRLPLIDPPPDVPDEQLRTLANHYRLTLVPDKYLKSFDVYLPHLLLTSATSYWEPAAWQYFLLPSRMIYHKRVSYERLSIQLSGFYSLYASIFRHEPDMNILSLAANVEGVYTRKYPNPDSGEPGREVKIEVRPRGFRASKLPLLALNLNEIGRRSDSSMYYQWLYVRELLSLHYVDIVEDAIRLSRIHNDVANNMWRINNETAPYLGTTARVSDLLPIDDKHIFHMLTSTSDSQHLVSTVEVPVPYYDTRFLDCKLWIGGDGTPKALLRSPLKIDVYCPPYDVRVITDIMMEDKKLLGVPASLRYNEESLILLRTAVARLPENIQYIITQPSAYADVRLLPFLLYMAVNKPYIVSLLALLLISRGALNDWGHEPNLTVVRDMMLAATGRVVLVDLDAYLPADEYDPFAKRAVTLFRADQIFDNISEPSTSLLSEYVTRHVDSLAEIREMFSKRKRASTNQFLRAEVEQYYGGRVYTLWPADRSKNREHKLFFRGPKPLHRSDTDQQAGEKLFVQSDVIIAEPLGNVYDTRTITITAKERWTRSYRNKQIRLMYLPLVPEARIHEKTKPISKTTP